MFIYSLRNHKTEVKIQHRNANKEKTLKRRNKVLTKTGRKYNKKWMNKTTLQATTPKRCLRVSQAR